MKQILKLTFFLLTLNLIGSISAIAQTAYVGETVYLSPPSVSGLSHAAYYCDDQKSHVLVSGNGTSGANVSILSYFSGVATIVCNYTYSNRYTRHGTGHEYYYIYCLPSTLTLGKKEIKLKVGESATLSYNNSSGVDLPYVLWKTSDDDVALFDNDGYTGTVSGQKTVTIYGKASGTCTITCYGHTGNDDPTCTVTVEDIPATDIKLDEPKVSIVEGQSKTLSYTLTPSNASSKVIWSSSMEDIVKVSSSGKITGISGGQATITATTTNGHSATCEVEVRPLAQTVSLMGIPQVTVGYAYKIEPVFTPSNAYASCTWKIADKSIAVVNASGWVTGKKVGTTTVTVTTQNKKTASGRITVKNASKGMDYRNVGVRVDALSILINNSLNNLK